MGLHFGLLGVILMLLGVIQAVAPGYAYQGPLAWALVAWGAGFAFVLAERFEQSRRG